MLDGTYFQGMCVLIASTKDYVINWQFCDREKTVAWEALLAKIPPPDIAIVDGQRGLEAALQNCWPDTKIQRCYFHIRLTGSKYLTRNPRLEENKALLGLYQALTAITCLEEAVAWQQQFHNWYHQNRQFLKQRSFLRNTPKALRPKHLQPGQISWYTHRATRSAYFSLKRLLQRDQLFTWLTARTSPAEVLPRATSRLEGQYNKPIKDLMRAHRGMSEPHATVAIAWFLYVRTEQALEPWKLVAPHHWQTPNQRRVVSTTNDTGAPALFDTNFSWEDGNGIQHGWGGRSH